MDNDSTVDVIHTKQSCPHDGQMRDPWKRVPDPMISKISYKENQESSNINVSYTQKITKCWPTNHITFNLCADDSITENHITEFIFRAMWFIAWLFINTEYFCCWQHRHSCYAKSRTAQDTFWPIPDLISCTGMTWRLGLHKMQSGDSALPFM